MQNKDLDNLREPFSIYNPDFPRGRALWLDKSFRDAKAAFPVIKQTEEYLPRDLNTHIFSGQEEIDRLWSSYKDHGYGFFLYSLVKVLQVKVCVELGVLQGFSLLTVASALRNNGKGIICGFDLFENYPYRNETFDNLNHRITEFGLNTWASVEMMDAFQVHKFFNKKVDYLHVDLSNDGDIYRKIFKQWAKKVQKVILLEGGSPARDQVSWMIKYNKPSIHGVLQELKDCYGDWDIVVLNPFPSLTVALRRS